MKWGGRLLFYVDGAERLWNFDNIFPPEEILNHKNAIIVILCTAYKAVYDWIRQNGCKNSILIAPLLGYRFICDKYQNPVDLLRIVKKFSIKLQNDAKNIYNLIDVYTRNFITQKIKESLNFKFYNISEYERFEYTDYFADNTISPKGAITLVDCGAYIGDSIIQIKSIYNENLKLVYAFEPDKNNMIALKNNLKGADFEIKCYQCGVYDTNGELKFKKVEDELEYDDNGDIIVPVKKIDDVLSDVVGTLAIKMDLEGSECSAIMGASKTIRKYKPYIVACVYHHMEDIINVPMMIKNICDGYKFYIRGGVHTEVYAVPYGLTV